MAIKGGGRMMDIVAFWKWMIFYYPHLVAEYIREEEE